MNLREALRSKKQSVSAMNYQANAWQVYGEDTLVLFYADWAFTSTNLDKLLDYLSLVDKLVVALPAKSKDDTLFRIANLQVVDGIVLYDDIKACMEGFSSTKFAFEGTQAPSVSSALKSRILDL